MDHASAAEVTPYKRGEMPTHDVGSVLQAATRFVPATDETHKLVTILEERLASVLTGEGSRPFPADDGLVKHSTSALAEQLEQHVSAIDNANGRLARLLDRIDL